MFLHRKRTRVDRDTENLDVGQELCPCLTQGEGQQLCYNLFFVISTTRNLAYITDTHACDRDGRIPEEEELVQAGDNDSPYETESPCTECRNGHLGIIGVGDGGTDLGIRRVILCRYGSVTRLRICSRCRGFTIDDGIPIEVWIIKLGDRNVLANCESDEVV